MLYLLRKGLWKTLPYYIIKRGVVSDVRSIIGSYSALLLRPILEGVIGVKPRGDTREKQQTKIRSLGWAFRTQIRTGKGQLFSALKSSGSGSLLMKKPGWK